MPPHPDRVRSHYRDDDDYVWWWCQPSTADGTDHAPVTPLAIAEDAFDAFVDHFRVFRTLAEFIEYAREEPARAWREIDQTDDAETRRLLTTALENAGLRR